MNDASGTSLEVANAIADGRHVDWDHVSQDGELSGTLRQLKALSLIGDVHHEQQQSTGSLDEFVDRPELRELIEERNVMFEWGHLEVLESIGEGTFGEVYRAYDPRLRNEVALKLLKADGPKRERAFLEEGRKLAKVQHTNVVTIHGIDCHDERHGIFMELVGGSTLEEVIRNEGVRSADEAATIGIQIAGALAAVHHQGLVHRDVKTSNVKRDPQGQIVLLDFSLTSDCESEAARDAGGTPAYMAPELLSGAQSNSATDIYALGAVLYRLVSGRLPLEAADCTDLLTRHQQGLAVPLRDRRPDLPPDFVAVVDRALDADPARRFQSAGELEQALRGHLGQTTGVVEDRSPSSSRRRWVLSATTIAAAVVAAWFIAPRLTAFEVEAALFKVGDDGDERLRAGSAIVPGDQLFLEIQSSRDAYVYIVDEDEAGNTFLLFPLPSLDSQNPLPGEAVHHLPGTGEAWDVTSAGGTESILVVASRKPQPELERIIKQFPAAGSSRAAVIEEPGFAGKLRGIGGLSERSKPRAPAGELKLPQLLVTASEKSGVWMWEMVLTGPAKGE